jgi:hypothetical protein
MSAITYRAGSYYCTACELKLQIPPGATVRHGYTTVQDGERMRVLIVDGAEVHRCADRETTGLSGTTQSARRH